jgi:hypothetical protein
MMRFMHFSAECHYAECRYTECRYADCRGALGTKLGSFSLPFSLSLAFSRFLYRSFSFCSSSLKREKGENFEIAIFKILQKLGAFHVF